MINYCLPLICPRRAQVLKSIDENLSEYRYFEVWLDYIEDLDDAFVGHLSDLYADNIIFLFRRRKLEPIQLALERRYFILEELSNKQSYLDLDLTQEDELKYLKAKNLKLRLISSYHNYKETPQPKDLDQIIQGQLVHQPEITKLACLCNSAEDALNLLQLGVRLKKQGQRYIVLGMGADGLATRVFGTLWGNEIIFAPLERSESSAPGQPTKRELERIFAALAV